ncbi:MAG: DNA repair and recombination protein RadA [bacterium]|nr:DNA repair and recombination protein RadA [bacterium]
MSETESIQDLPGVGPVSVEKLITHGFDTMLSIAVSSPAQIADASGLSEPKARTIIQAARNALNFNFTTAFDEKRTREKEVFKIPTGSTKLDGILDGGFESGIISETFAKFGAGKSQIAHQLCVNIHKLDPAFKAIYIDTEHSFRPERIDEMAREAGLDSDKILKNVIKTNVFNSDHQMFMVEQTEGLIKKDKNIKLLIVDSIIDHFRHEFPGRGQLADRQHKLNKHLHFLAKVAKLYNVVVYVTNQVMDDPGLMYGDPVKAAGGNIVGHICQTRLYLRRSQKGVTAKVIDAPNLAPAEAIFQITKEGIRDE